jgi:hypothetical protein
MAETTGTVSCVRVAEAAGFLVLQVQQTEVPFVLWFAPGSIFPRDLNSFTRVLHSMWLSLIREAHATGATVTVVHGNNDSNVTALGIGATP